MEIVNYFEILDTDHFWKNFGLTYPDFDTKDIWYEVFIDFMEDEFEEDRSLKYNLKKAKRYLSKHRKDYD